MTNSAFLGSVEFPPYFVNSLSDRHIIVGGGGGRSKTGVKNLLTVFELKHKPKSGVTLIPVFEHTVGDEAVMNGDLAQTATSFILALGEGDRCELLEMKYKLLTTQPPQTENDSPSGNYKVRNRHSKMTNSESHEQAQKVVSFHTQCLANVRTAGADSDSGSTSGGRVRPISTYQKVVRFSIGGHHLYTGSSDGYLAVWKTPKLENVKIIKAHKDDIDDIAVCPDGKKIVTVSRDHVASLWETEKFTKIEDLQWQHDTSTKFKFRAARYGPVPDKGKTKSKLFTIHIAAIRLKTPSKSYLVKWKTDVCPGYTIERLVSTGTQVLSSLAVSDNGTYLGLASIDGAVSIYIAFSLQKAYDLPNAHTTFVTDMTFVSSSKTSQHIMGDDCDCSLISVSADQQVKLHQLKTRRSYSFKWLLIGAVCLAYLSLWFISYMGFPL